MADSEMSMQDKAMQGFYNALENLPILISVFTGKTSMLLRHKPTDSEESIFLENLKMFLAANAKKITDVLLWMLPKEIEVEKIKIDKDTNTGKVYFEELAQALSAALLNGTTSRAVTESKGYLRGAVSGAPKIEFELTDGDKKTTAEIKEIAHSVRFLFLNQICNGCICCLDQILGRKN